MCTLLTSDKPYFSPLTLLSVNALHTNLLDSVSQGNARADATVKAAARQPVSATTAALMLTSSFKNGDASLAKMQSLATPKDREDWRSSGAGWDRIFNVWVGLNGNSCLPKHFSPHFAKGLNHVSKEGLLELMNQFWFTRGFLSWKRSIVNQD